MPSNGQLYCWLDQEYSTSLSSDYWNAWAHYIAEYDFAGLGTYPLYPCLYCDPYSPYPNCSTIAKVHRVDVSGGRQSGHVVNCRGVCRQLRRGSRRGRGEQAVLRRTGSGWRYGYSARAADAAEPVEACRTGGGRRGVRDGRTRMQRSGAGARRRRSGLVRGGVLRAAGVCARQTGPWRLRVYQMAPGTGNGAAEPAAWRALVRSAVLFAAGIVDVIAPARTGGAHYRAWFGGGMLAGGTILLVLSMRMPVRTPVCRRPLLRRMRATLRMLAGHEMFTAMAASVGPFGPVARYRRTGCTDEFWFSAAAGQGQAVVFRVSHAAPSGRLAVHASLRDGRTPATWPARAISVQKLAG